MQTPLNPGWLEEADSRHFWVEGKFWRRRWKLSTFANNGCMAVCVRKYISGYLNMIGQSSCTAVDWAGVPVGERVRAVEGNHWPFLRSLSFTDKETVVLVIFALGIYLSIWHSSIWLDSHIDFWESYLNFQIIVRNFIMISLCVSRGPNGWEI